MAIQLANDVIVAFKPEVTFNTAPGDTGAERLRITGSPGMSLVKTLIRSGEVRLDALSTQSRHGSQSVPASYNVEVSVDSLDTVLQANMRGTWVAAVAITQATMTSITTTTNTIVAAAGSWLTQGVRAGDVARLTGHATAANNSKNLRILSVTASTLTLPAGSLTADAVADTTFTLTILRKLSNPAAPTRRSFYFEEYDRGVDVTAVSGGQRFVGFTLAGTPDGMVTSTISLLGASLTPLASGASPYYTSPTETTTAPLVAVDATVCFNGVDVATCTAWNLEYAIAAETIPVVGTTVTPDVADTRATLSGSLTFAREDLSRLTLYKNETGLQLHLLLVEQDSEPKDCISFFIGNLVLSGLTTEIAESGARFETIPFTVGVPVGVPATTGYDASLMTICTSAS